MMSERINFSNVLPLDKLKEKKPKTNSVDKNSSTTQNINSTKGVGTGTKGTGTKGTGTKGTGTKETATGGNGTTAATTNNRNNVQSHSIYQEEQSKISTTNDSEKIETKDGAEKDNKLEDKILPLIDLKKIASSPFLFIKSYYAHDFLNPYIKCFIQNKLYTEESTPLQKKNFQKNFFDIPYNLIKSMDLEYVGGGGVEGKLTLKIEDTTGSIGTFLLGAFYAISITGNNDKSCSVNIEFGWSPKGLKKISKKNKKKIFTRNIYPQYVITNVELDFDEKGRQEITVTAQQDGTGAAIYMSEKSGMTPHAILGTSPISNIRLIQYYHYFKSKGKEGLSIFKSYTNANKTQKSQYEKYIKDFTTLPLFTNNDQKTQINTKNILKDLSGVNTSNVLFNSDINPNNSLFNNIKDIFSDSLANTHFNSYLIFCYLLNQYISTLKEITSKKEGKEIKVFCLQLYDEDDIDNTGLLIQKFSDLKEFSISDVSAGREKEKAVNVTLTNDSYKIEASEKWETLLERTAKVVKFKNLDPKKKSNLFITIKRYSNSGDNLYEKRNDDLYKVSAKEEIINKFETLSKLFVKKGNHDISSNIENLIKDIKNFKEDFIYIVLTKGAAFLTDESYGDKIIAQSYTVFPKIDISDRLKDQNFNSGSNSLLNESFPDVIYFKPKFSFKSIVNSNLSRNSDINYNNGAFSFKLNNISVKNINNQSLDADKIRSLIQSLKSFLNSNKSAPKFILPVGQDSEDKLMYYSFDNISTDLKISHKTMAKYTTITNKDSKEKEDINSLINDLEEYYNTFKRGYHYTTLLGIIKKTDNISIGDNNTANYYNYITAANEYNRMLSELSRGFEAELKILGEPGFTLDFSSLIHVFIKVNNSDGNQNRLLSGLYSVKKIKHEITDKGSFTTTLNLLFDSPYYND